MTNCVNCKEVITNPICPKCISVAVYQWVSDKKVFLDLPSEDHSENLHGENCIKCGACINLCSYCYTKDVYEQVEEEYPELLGEFVEFFSFDLDKKGYAKEYLS